jgi:hypothetical protein
MLAKTIPKFLVFTLIIGVCLAGYFTMPVSQATAAELQTAYGGSCLGCNCLSSDTCGGCNDDSTCAGSSKGAHCGDEGTDDQWECGTDDGTDCEPSGEEPENDAYKCKCDGDTANAHCEESLTSNTCTVTGQSDDCTPHC